MKLLPFRFMIFSLLYCASLVSMDSGKDSSDKKQNIIHNCYQQKSQIITPTRMAVTAGIVIGSYAVYKWLNLYTSNQAKKDGKKLRKKINNNTEEIVTKLETNKLQTNNNINFFIGKIKKANDDYHKEIILDINNCTDELQHTENKLKENTNLLSKNYDQDMDKKNKNSEQLTVIKENVNSLSSNSNFLIKDSEEINRNLKDLINDQVKTTQQLEQNQTVQNKKSEEKIDQYKNDRQKFNNLLKKQY